MLKDLALPIGYPIQHVTNSSLSLIILLLGSLANTNFSFTTLSREMETNLMVYLSLRKS